MLAIWYCIWCTDDVVCMDDKCLSNKFLELPDYSLVHKANETWFTVSHCRLHVLFAPISKFQYWLISIMWSTDSWIRWAVVIFWDYQIPEYHISQLWKQSYYRILASINTTRCVWLSIMCFIVYIPTWWCNYKIWSTHMEWHMAPPKPHMIIPLMCFITQSLIIPCFLGYHNWWKHQVISYGSLKLE